MDQHRSRRAFWPSLFAILVALPILYVASFGPACRVTAQNGSATNLFRIAYRPMEVTLLGLPRPAAEAVVAYVHLWLPYDAYFTAPYQSADGRMAVGIAIGCFLPPLGG